MQCCGRKICSPRHHRRRQEIDCVGVEGFAVEKLTVRMMTSNMSINKFRIFLSNREIPKKATAVQLSPDGQTILVADKFGDVFSYPINPPIDTIIDPAHSSRPKDAQASHENIHGSLVLGHASVITSFLLSHDGQYIITADRDEHIRVSRYPNGYDIERYCLGHEL